MFIFRKDLRKSYPLLQYKKKKRGSSNLLPYERGRSIWSQLTLKNKFEHKPRVIYSDINSKVIFIYMRNYI